jgi:hypothetical protein
VNRGGGGAGGGNGGTIANAKGTSGAAGVVILKWALRGAALVSYSGTPTYRNSTTLTATTNTASKVTFYANEKRIAGCVAITTSANTATCNWKPAVHGNIALSVQVTPTDSNYASNRVRLSPINAVKRSGNR